QQRIDTLQAHGIGRREAYATVQRERSLDNKTKNPTLNDFDFVLKDIPIKLIIANARTASNAMINQPVCQSYDVVSALSTSGLNSGREKERMEQWTQAIRSVLN